MEGSFALHMRKLFLTNDAEFAAVRDEEGKVRLDFVVPAVRSRFAISAGGASAPVAFAGVGLVRARESHRGAASGEIVLRDRDGSERRNRSVFQDCRRFAGSSTVHYGK
jgi:hypothetical protein